MAKRAGPVTAQERSLASRKAHAVDREAAASVRLAGRLGTALRRSILTAWRHGQTNMSQLVSQQMRAVQPTLVELMVLSHLKGLQQSIDGLLPGTFSLHGRAVQVLRRRLQMTADELDDLERAYEAQAMRVLARVSDDVEQRVQKAIAKAIQIGSTTTEGTKIVALACRGIEAKSTFEWETVFRTQANLAYSAAEYQAFNDPEMEDIVWGYKYVTVGDDRVREEHMALDGVTLEKDDTLWNTIWPPNGWACRCTVIAITRPREEKRPPEPFDVTYQTDKGEDVIKHVVPGPDKGFDWNPGQVFGALPDEVQRRLAEAVEE